MSFDPEDLILDIMQNMMSGTSGKETQNATANALSIGLSKADASKPNEESVDNVGNNASAASGGFDPSAGNEF